MLISTQTSTIAAHLSHAEAIRILAAAGFDAFDFSLFDHTPENLVFTDGWRDYVLELRRIADTAGILCNQAHAPFPSRKAEIPQNEAFNDTIFDHITRAMAAAALLGAKAIVVHPIHHVPHWENAEYLRDLNLDFYRSLIPYAKEYRIRVALENMWQVRDGHIVDSTCSQAAEFADYLDTLADDCFTGCLDLGHCGLTGHEASEMIRALGADRIGALHVHDNNHKGDQHTLPYQANMDWNAIVSALADIGYRGDMTLEADNFLAAVPPTLYPAAAEFMCRTARSLAQQITVQMTKQHSHI